MPLEINDKIIGKNSLDKWLDKDTLSEIIKVTIFNDRIKEDEIPDRILKDSSEFLLSYFGPDILSNKTIRENLVKSLMEKESALGLKKLLRRYDQFGELPRTEEEKFEKAVIQRWVRGGPSAIEFSRFFGFPEPFAGTRLGKYELIPVEEIMAREDWKGLHNYQSVLLEKMQKWFESPDEKFDSSGMLILPTGTGKTRVAVNLIIEDFRRIFNKRGRIRHCVLWIAHTKELCEQAIDTMSRMWMIQGEQGQYLKIYRLWEDISPGNLIGSSGIIVAGIQKLSRLLDNEEDRIIFNNHIKPKLRLIVIDEAHLADNPSYLRLLDFLSKVEEFVPEGGNGWKLLGLTATPFKREDLRTKKLQNIFRLRFMLDKNDGGYLTDIDRLGVNRWMQKYGFLSHEITYKTFQMKEQYTFSFSNEEKRYLAQFQDFNDTALKRLSIQMERNEYIIEKVKWAIKNENSKKVLLFACSVPHCYILNSQFSQHGIDSLFVTGEMSKQERAENINQFRKNTLEKPIVLINYAILTMGFDDPLIDTIFITRPTCSRVLYHQMIGRGLRGINNGGNKNGKCVIIDIKDNFETFQGFRGVINFNDEAKELKAQID